MASAPRLTNPVWQAGLLGLALVVGVLAGYRPGWGLLAAIGAVFALIIILDLAAGLCLFVVLSFLEVLPDLGVPGLSAAKLVGLLLVLSWLAVVVVRGTAGASLLSSHPGFSSLLVAFVGWVALSSLWADQAGPVGDATVRYGLNVVLVAIVFTAVRRSDHLIWTAAAFATGASLAALYGFANPDSAGRLAGAAGDPNVLAASLVAGLVLAAALAAISRPASPARAAALTAAFVCGAGILLSVSRGGLVALVVVLISGVLLVGRRRLLAAAVAALLLIAAAGYFTVLASPEARERVTSIEEGGTGRTDIWQVGWRMAQANPTLGVGAGNFQGSAVRYVLEPGSLRRTDLLIDKPRVAHNTYLQVLSELGIVGLALLLLIIGFSLSCTARAVRAFERAGDMRLGLLARAILVATLGLLVAGFFISANYSNQLWLMLALGPALLAVAQQGSDRGRRREPDRSSSAPDPLEQGIGATGRP